MKRTALITGITGQDGSYLADHLLSLGYEVHGLVRPGATPRTQNIAHLMDPEMKINLSYGDLIDSRSLRAALERIQPNEVYNLGAQAHVGISFTMPEYTAQVTGIGCLRMLEAIRDLELPCRFYQASSSEMFGKVAETPQNERTPFHPRSPYGTAKAMAYYTTINYREAYGIHAVNGILFNHGSPRRGEYYVTRKVALSVARIRAGLQTELRLGNLDAKRDWGYAPEFVEGIYLMLQHEDPGDYVLATGETHTVRDLVQIAFDHVGMDWERYVKIDPRFMRPAEVDLLRGDASKAEADFGWKHRTTFKELVELMVDADVERIAAP